ncbi:hypothetical protein Tsubulata_025874 [Turnera subulata]|uniref:F-box domain-containing protein n=1 Tax=Turnera subulata TaxID=218843 RepID=A0A9Q0G2F8_9ROSI|nr:hypothetical protein Tsubulata_025874 [Turnera subulata]
MPEDLVEEILSQLPAKSLVRFTSVYISWRRFMRDDPAFKALHSSKAATAERCSYLFRAGRRDSSPAHTRKENKEYRIVSLIDDYFSLHRRAAYVYSSRADSWNQIDMVSSGWNRIEFHRPTILDGAPHWLAIDRTQNLQFSGEAKTIISFDFDTERFGCIALPTTAVDQSASAGFNSRDSSYYSSSFLLPLHRFYPCNQWFTKTPDKEKKKAPVVVPLKKPLLKVSWKLSLGGEGSSKTRSKRGSRVYNSLWEPTAGYATVSLGEPLWDCGNGVLPVVCGKGFQCNPVGVRSSGHYYLYPTGFPAVSATFPVSQVYHLPTLCSDHCPLLIDLGFNLLRDLKGSGFKLLAAWLSHSDFQSFISSHWDVESTVPDALESLAGALTGWKTSVFWSVIKHKRILLKRLVGIQRYLSLRPSQFLSALEVELRRKYSAVLG